MLEPFSSGLEIIRVVEFSYMAIEGLKEFLVAANKAGYAGGDEKEWIKELDGSTSIVFEQDNRKMHDNFFGGEPYGGRIVVLNNEKAEWMMVYYGWVEEGVNPDIVYGILREALMQMPEEYPFRGPEVFKKGNLTYRNKWDGKVERYLGEKEILEDERLVYKANYFGGLVDKRRGV